MSRPQQGIAPPLQQAAPFAQHDVPAVVFPFFIIGHLSPAQHDADPQHIIPSAIFPSFVMGHLPSLQQLLSLPQHDFPSAIFPSFIIGHLSPTFRLAMSWPQHAQPFDASPAAGAAGTACVAVCAIIASANNIVTTTNITFDFMIPSFS
ncbi:MAG: hypothetical protein WAN69_08910 [Candidatus Korobacteraceae bacterium]